MKQETIESRIRSSSQVCIRFTKQRRLLYNLILENPDLTCKELFYLANSLGDVAVSLSTAYRTLRQIEQAGILLDKKIISLGKEGEQYGTD